MSKCTFCDEIAFDYEAGIAGGAFSFYGNGVCEQPIAFDLCTDHWHTFYDHLRKFGWITPNEDSVRLINWVESKA